MKIKWTKVAVRDLDDIMVYIGKDAPEPALAILDGIEEKAEILERHPWIGRKGRKVGTRELVLNGLPYCLIYKVNPEWITILRVLHQARLWPDNAE